MTAWADQDRRVAPSDIAMVDYADLSYQELEERSYVKAPSREGIVAETIRMFERDQVNDLIESK